MSKASSSCCDPSLVGACVRRDLPHTFVPGDHDVICGKGMLRLKNLLSGDFFKLSGTILCRPHLISSSLFRNTGKGCFNHEGNKKFRKSVGFFLERYSNAKSKAQKSVIVSAIIDTVRSQAGDGGFVKKDASTGHWYEVGDFLA